MPRRSEGTRPEQADLFSVAPDALALHRASEHDWPDAGRFPHNRPGQRVRDTVRADLLASIRPVVVAGFTSIGELVDLVDAWLRARTPSTDDDGCVRVLLGSEPFSTTRRAFASPKARFTEEVRRYWLEERGISLDLSAAVVAAIEAIDSGQLVAGAVVGDRPLHAKIFVGVRRVRRPARRRVGPPLPRGRPDRRGVLAVAVPAGRHRPGALDHRERRQRARRGRHRLGQDPHGRSSRPIDPRPAVEHRPGAS